MFKRVALIVISLASFAVAGENVPLTINANQLLRDYEANEYAANLKYKGKTIVISGTVSSIEADVDDEPVIRFEAGGDFSMSSVDAYPDQSIWPEVGTMNAGQRITLVCIGNSEIMGDPQLAGCVLP